MTPHQFQQALEWTRRFSPDPAFSEILEDRSVTSMSVKGRTLRYNPDFVTGISEQLCRAILLHELKHIELRHSDRLGDRTLTGFNVAADCEVNDRLRDDYLAAFAGNEEQFLAEMVHHPTTCGCFPGLPPYEDLPRGKTAEEYYDLLREKFMALLPDLAPLLDNFTVNQFVPFRRVGDLLCSAFEGGSNYWCHIDEFHEPPKIAFRWDSKNLYKHVDYPLNPGGYLLISDPEDGEGDQHRLDLNSLQNGLRVMNAKYPEHWRDFMAEADDATTGDVFLQCCLFGEVIYE